MIRMASLIDTFDDDFRAQYRDRLTPDHLRALAAMQHCRREASPKMQVACSECDHRALVPHSCGHRHCPHCQHHESQQWLERQIQRSGAQFRFPAPELQAPDCVAAPAAEVRAATGIAMDQGTHAHCLRLLWRGDEDRAHTDFAIATGRAGGDAGRTRHPLIL
jgi:hypothetical protein